MALNFRQPAPIMVFDPICLTSNAIVHSELLENVLCQAPICSSFNGLRTA